MKLKPLMCNSLILSLYLLLIQGTICWATNYFYDNLNRLIRVQHEDGTNILYTYDEVGNRLSRVVGPDSRHPTLLPLRPSQTELRMYLTVQISPGPGATRTETVLRTLSFLTRIATRPHRSHPGRRQVSMCRT